jgi:hypothetical protein
MSGIADAAAAANLAAAANAAVPPPGQPPIVAGAAQVQFTPPPQQQQLPPAPGQPPQGGAPPPGVVPGILPQANITARPYREWYHDNTRDPFIGNYPAIYNNYTINPINTPAVVHSRILTNGNNGVPINHLLVVQPTGAPADEPGTIQGFHRAVRYEPSLVGATPFDNIGYSFLGDVLNGQVPHTVIWADEYFHRTNGPHRRLHGPTPCSQPGARAGRTLRGRHCGY